MIDRKGVFGQLAKDTRELKRVMVERESDGWGKEQSSDVIEFY